MVLEKVRCEKMVNNLMNCNMWGFFYLHPSINRLPTAYKSRRLLMPPVWQILKYFRLQNRLSFTDNNLLWSCNIKKSLEQHFFPNKLLNLLQKHPNLSTFSLEIYQPELFKIQTSSIKFWGFFILFVCNICYTDVKRFIPISQLWDHKNFNRKWIFVFL